MHACKNGEEISLFSHDCNYFVICIVYPYIISDATLTRFAWPVLGGSILVLVKLGSLIPADARERRHDAWRGGLPILDRSTGYILDHWSDISQVVGYNIDSGVLTAHIYNILSNMS